MGSALDGGDWRRRDRARLHPRLRRGKSPFIVGYILGVGAGGLPARGHRGQYWIFAHRFRATAAGWITVAGVLGAIGVVEPLAG